jgi:hypothetical protein
MARIARLEAWHCPSWQPGPLGAWRLAGPCEPGRLGHRIPTRTRIATAVARPRGPGRFDADHLRLPLMRNSIKLSCCRRSDDALPRRAGIARLASAGDGGSQRNAHVTSPTPRRRGAARARKQGRKPAARQAASPSRRGSTRADTPSRCRRRRTRAGSLQRPPALHRPPPGVHGRPGCDLGANTTRRAFHLDVWRPGHLTRKGRSPAAPLLWSRFARGGSAPLCCSGRSPRQAPMPVELGGARGGGWGGVDGNAHVIRQTPRRLSSARALTQQQLGAR